MTSLTTIKMDTENTRETKKKLKKKRKRTVISADEMVILESSFKKENRPDRFAKMRLAKQLGKSESFISIWFQNRRARDRREKRLLSEDGSCEISEPNISIRACQTTENGDSEEQQPLDLTKKTPEITEDNEPSENEMSVVRSPLFSRLIRMAAAAEGGILTTDCPFVGQAVTDACRGIRLNDGRILYDPVNGFEIEFSS